MAVARGDEPADLVLSGGHVLSVFTKEWLDVDVAVKDGHVVGLGRYHGHQNLDVAGAYLVPGFIDAHMHIESSKLMVDEFARAVLAQGTTAVVADPVEWQLDPTPKLAWPMEVGKWGVIHNGILHNRDHPTGVRIRLTWEVKAYESVRVPAGTFQAFRIEYLAELGATADVFRRGVAVPGRQFWTLVTWYAPDARRLVKADAGDLKALDFQVVTLDRGAAAALQVLVDEPRDQARVSADRITLGGKVTAAAGVAGLSITLNGVDVWSRDFTRSGPPPEVTLSHPVALRDGKNVLLVTATDTRGGSRQAASARSLLLAAVFYRRFYEANGMLGVLLDRRMPRRNRDAPNRHPF